VSSAGRFRRGRRKTGGRVRGTPNRATADVRQFARQLVEDPLYVARLMTRMRSGNAGAMEPLVWQYAYGKPRPVVIEPIQSDTNGPPPDLSKLSNEELDLLEPLLVKADPGL